MERERSWLFLPDDSRDFAFKKFNLPIKQVIAGPAPETESFDSKESTCINSFSELLNINGLTYFEAFIKVSNWIDARKSRKRKNTIQTKRLAFCQTALLGEPIPLVHYEAGFTKDIPESELPLTFT